MGEQTDSRNQMRRGASLKMYAVLDAQGHTGPTWRPQEVNNPVKILHGGRRAILKRLEPPDWDPWAKSSEKRSCTAKYTSPRDIPTNKGIKKGEDRSKHR